MSPYEVKAREWKAQKIADHALAQWRKILADYGVAEDASGLSRFIIELAGADEHMLWCWATNAGTRKPSAATWLSVIEIVARQGALARSRAAA